MAATNYTPIQLYHSTTASAVPVNTNLVNGELAINITDGKLYYKDNGGTVQIIASKGTGTIGGSTTQVQYNSSGALAGSANFTFNGTTATINTLNLTNALGATYGGTAQSSWTTGDLLYASGSNTLAKLGIGLNTYILTSDGSIPGWAAPSAISVNTATNLAGGAAGSVPYQSGAGATTFLSIGTVNQVVTSTGSAPQWSSGLSITTLTASDAVTFSATTQNIALGTSQTSGTFTIGGAAQTGTQTIDQSTKTHTLNIGAGATENTLTKTINIGTGGVSGSTTAINIGSTNGTTITLNGTVNATTVNVTTLDLTNLEVTNIKAKDGTASASIADSTGVMSLVANPVFSGGTANGVLYLNGSKVATSGSALTFDGTILSLSFSGSNPSFSINRTDASTAGVFSVEQGQSATFITSSTAKPIAFQVNAVEQMRLTSTGLGIGTSSPTNTLSVTGNANITGNTTLGDASTDTVLVNGYMGVGGAANSVVGLTVASSALTGVAQYGVVSQPVGTSSGTTALIGLQSQPSTAASSYTVGDVIGVRAFNATKGAGSTITNQHGLYVSDQTQGTNNYGITSVVTSGSNKWNIYASGTAANYFAGSVGIGVASPGVKLDIKQSGANWYDGLRIVRSTNDNQRLALGNTTGAGYIAAIDAAGGTNNALLFGRSTDGTTFTESARFDSSGNLGLGVTPSAWDTTFTAAFQIGGAALTGTSGNNTALASNAYYNLGWRYYGTTTATLFQQISGQHRWFTAPSGTANNAITFTERANIGLTEMVVNDPGNDYDFRVESDTNTHRLFVDGGADTVLMGTTTNTNSSKLVVDGTISETVGGVQYLVASQADIGTAPNEIPLNQYLGALAYEDTETPALDVGTGISTGTGTICKANGGQMGGIYRMTILIDLTGLNSGGTAGDIIGVNGTALPCYIARLPAMTVLGGRMTCLETPAGGDTDIDLYSATEGTGVEDQAITALTETQIINAGAQTVGTVTYFSADPAANAYFYLVGQGTANATYTAGRFLIEIFGVQ